jgi:hypothetical protein
MPWPIKAQAGAPGKLSIIRNSEELQRVGPIARPCGIATLAAFVLIAAVVIGAL